MRMMPSILLLTLALPGAAALAQTTRSETPKVVLKDQPWVMNSVTGCPIQFSAQRYGLTAAMRETSRGKVDDFAQSMQIRFSPGGLSRVQSVELVVRGMAAKAEM